MPTDSTHMWPEEARIGFGHTTLMTSRERLANASGRRKYHCACATARRSQICQNWVLEHGAGCDLTGATQEGKRTPRRHAAGYSQGDGRRKK
ncbi:hypothetical protein FKM82_013604 [Ascaphus truei]